MRQSQSLFHSSCQSHCWLVVRTSRIPSALGKDSRSFSVTILAMSRMWRRCSRFAKGLSISSTSLILLRKLLLMTCTQSISQPNTRLTQPLSQKSAFNITTLISLAFWLNTGSRNLSLGSRQTVQDMGRMVRYGAVKCSLQTCCISNGLPIWLMSHCQEVNRQFSNLG